MDILLILNLCLFCLIMIIIIYKFILIILIVIEFMILRISLIIYIVLRILRIEVYIIYYLIFRVCERVLGLMILILIIRYHGEEIYYSINLFKFNYDKSFCYINFFNNYIN